jgi:aconitate hydratase
VFAGDDNWRNLEVPTGDMFTWDESSTYVRQPPYFNRMPPAPEPLHDITGARVPALLGDSVTTDHISPAGRSSRTPRPAVSWWSMVWGPVLSTPTGPGAATTRS